VEMRITYMFNMLRLFSINSSRRKWSAYSGIWCKIFAKCSRLLFYKSLGYLSYHHHITCHRLRNTWHALLY
jgi:hypothetical protein